LRIIGRYNSITLIAVCYLNGDLFHERVDGMYMANGFGCIYNIARLLQGEMDDAADSIVAT